MARDGSTIGDLVRYWATATPDAIAVVAPGRAPLTYGAYGRQVEYTGTTLRSLGLGRGHRIATVLPTGAEAAVCYAAVCSHATAAPLNPAYTAEEFCAYFSNLSVDAVIMMRGDGTAARAAVARLDIPAIDLVPERSGPVGAFRLSAGISVGPAPSDRPGPDDIASVLQSSGTTSRPKVIPLTHRNIIARAVMENCWYGIGPEDRALCLNPLYHHSGLKKGVIEPLQSGGSTIAVARPGVSDFLDMLAACRPTWCTGSATFFHEIARAAGGGGATLRRHDLRYFRSGSTRLLPAVAAAIEEAFGVPILNAYSSSEAGMMASNPLPPGVRRSETVGLPIGADVAILDDDGKELAAGEPGEVAVRGPTVMAGYETDPEANAQSFCGGWFRTGDMGYFDDTGYLLLTGRIREVINRGGEKISPAEIDAVLESHPAVVEAAAFGLAHPTLNELVVAAVIVRDRNVSERELRQHVRSSLAPSKVPATIFFVDCLPRNRNGKLQRNKLADQIERKPTQQPAQA